MIVDSLSWTSNDFRDIGNEYMWNAGPIMASGPISSVRSSRVLLAILRNAVGQIDELFRGRHFDRENTWRVGLSLPCRGQSWLLWHFGLSRLLPVLPTKRGRTQKQSRSALVSTTSLL